jgi:XTP/dITP diphosphohydrolase
MSCASEKGNCPHFCVVLASRNAHKLREVRQIFAAAGFDIDLGDLDEFPDVPETPETGATFAENASAKARAAAQATGMIAIADDSGLEVDALAGRPGVESNRFAGPGADDAARIAKLLGMMRDVDGPQRTARFRCAAAIAVPDGEVSVVEGVLEGMIAAAPRGEHGFGYDPVFVPLGETRTLAEMTAQEKNRISHRGQAFRAAAEMLATITEQSDS